MSLYNIGNKNYEKKKRKSEKPWKEKKEIDIKYQNMSNGGMYKKTSRNFNISSLLSVYERDL